MTIKKNREHRRAELYASEQVRDLAEKKSISLVAAGRKLVRLRQKRSDRAERKERKARCTIPFAGFAQDRRSVKNYQYLVGMGLLSLTSEKATI